MYTQNRFIVIAAFALATVVSASSHPTSFSPAYAKFKLLQNQPFILGGFSGHPALAKQAAVKTSDATLTRIESYSWNNSGWSPDGNTLLTYDDQGRVIEWSDGSSVGDSSYSKTTFEYNDALKRVRMLSYSKDSSQWYSSEDIDIIDYYFLDRQTFNNGIVTSFPLTLLDLGATQSLAIDSIIYLYSSRNQQTGDWDTTAYYKQIYNYNGTSITATYENKLETNDFADMVTQKYLYRLDDAGRLDTLIEQSFDSAGQQQLETRIVYSYENNRVGSMTIILASINVSDFYIEEKITLSYLTSGRVGTYLTEMRNSPDSSMNNFTKQELIYTPSGIATFNSTAAPLQASLTVNHGSYLIAPPAGSTISEVAFFDLNGRVIDRKSFTGSSTDRTISLPCRATAHSVNLMRVRTDRGIFNFRIKESAATRNH